MSQLRKNYLIGILVVVIGAAFTMAVSGCQSSGDNQKGSATKDASISDVKKSSSEDVKTPPRFPFATGDVKGSSDDIQAYVTRYYKAYKAQDWKPAYDLLPEASRQTQTLDDFIGRRASAPLEQYEVKKAFVQASGDVATVYVLYSITHYGDWISTWDFKKEGNFWVPLSLQTTVR